MRRYREWLGLPAIMFVSAASVACQPPRDGEPPPPTRLEIARDTFDKAETVFVGRVLTARSHSKDYVHSTNATIKPLRLYKGNTAPYRVQKYVVHGMDCSGQGGPVAGQQFAYFAARVNGKPDFIVALPLFESESGFVAESVAIIKLLEQRALAQPGPPPR